MRIGPGRESEPIEIRRGGACFSQIGVSRTHARESTPNLRETEVCA
jgi:hypothetical protein